MNLRGGIVVSLLIVAVLAGCAEETGCSDKAPVGKTLLTSPGDSAFRAIAPDSFVAQFETSRGDFKVLVIRSWAPRGADRFYNLVRNGFYDGNRFFRVLDGFIVQWGVHGDPAVSKAWQRMCIQDDPVYHANTRPAVTFAFGLPNTRTTQLFINYGMNQNLDRLGFAPFGYVSDGLTVVDSLYQDYGEMPPGGTGPDPLMMIEEGNGYLDREFPKLDSIVRARVISETRR